MSIVSFPPNATKTNVNIIIVMIKSNIIGMILQQQQLANDTQQEHVDHAHPLETLFFFFVDNCSEIVARHLSISVIFLSSLENPTLVFFIPNKKILFF